MRRELLVRTGPSQRASRPRHPAMLGYRGLHSVGKNLANQLLTAAVSSWCSHLNGCCGVRACDAAGGEMLGVRGWLPVLCLLASCPVASAASLAATEVQEPYLVHVHRQPSVLGAVGRPLVSGKCQLV